MSDGGRAFPPRKINSIHRSRLAEWLQEFFHCWDDLAALEIHRAFEPAFLILEMQS